jgi:hypothetical protein
MEGEQEQPDLLQILEELCKSTPEGRAVIIQDIIADTALLARCLSAEAPIGITGLVGHACERQCPDVIQGLNREVRLRIKMAALDYGGAQEILVERDVDRGKDSGVVGKLLLHRALVEQDIKKREDFLRRAIANGNSDAVMYLAQFFKENSRSGDAIQIAQLGLKRHKDVMCLYILIKIYFETKDERSRAQTVKLVNEAIGMARRAGIEDPFNQPFQAALSSFPVYPDLHPDDYVDPNEPLYPNSPDDFIAMKRYVAELIKFMQECWAAKD